MFEHLLRQKLGHDTVLVESAAGLQEAAGKEAEEGAVIALKGFGIDISSHRARFIGDLNLSQFTAIYCMDPGVLPIVHEKLALQDVVVPVHLVNGPEGIPNPYGKDQEAYNLALEVTRREVDRVFSEDLFPML